VAERKKAGVLISGNGSNLQALIDACKHSDFPAEIAVVISNKSDAYGLNRASEAGIATHVVDHKPFSNREAFDSAVNNLLMRYQVDIVCLAGFMRILSEGFVRHWQGRMLNIHPSLLPAFKGAHAHRDVIAYGVRISGCTVHFVSAEMDAGPIIVQAAVPVLPGDTEQSLGQRVLEQEHVCYPLAVRWLAEGRLSIVDGKVQIQESTPGHGVSKGGVLLNPDMV
jgi:phosphoribosylglycinamide formyltransferase-1